MPANNGGGIFDMYNSPGVRATIGLAPLNNAGPANPNTGGYGAANNYGFVAGSPELTQPAITTSTPSGTGFAPTGFNNFGGNSAFDTGTPKLDAQTGGTGNPSSNELNYISGNNFGPGGAFGGTPVENVTKALMGRAYPSRDGIMNGLFKVGRY